MINQSNLGERRLIAAAERLSELLGQPISSHCTEALWDLMVSHGVELRFSVAGVCVYITGDFSTKFHDFREFASRQHTVRFGVITSLIDRLEKLERIAEPV
jgi:hypothetical protein